MKFAPHFLGRLGERLAAWLYRLRGYSILARNVRSKSGEIDFIARRGDTVVIAEVKTRQSHTAGAGHEAVTRTKQNRLLRLGSHYAANHPMAQLRYDVISIFWTRWWFAIEQHADAFCPIADPRRPWQWRAGVGFASSAERRISR